MEASMNKINVDIERCKGCYYCVENCPVDAISASGRSNTKSYVFITVDQEKCVACGNCYKVCPDCVFEII